MTVGDALEEAGIPFHRDGSKTVLALPDGTQVSFGTAVKHGLIKVSRA